MFLISMTVISGNLISLNHVDTFVFSLTVSNTMVNITISNIKSHGDRVHSDVFSFSPLSQKDLFIELASVKERKSAGYDQIPTRVINLSKLITQKHVT